MMCGHMRFRGYPNWEGMMSWPGRFFGPGEVRLALLSLVILPLLYWRAAWFSKSMRPLFRAIQDVFLCPEVTIA